MDSHVPVKSSIHGAPGAVEEGDLLTRIVPKPLDVDVASMEIRNPHGCFCTKQKEERKKHPTIVALDSIGKVEIASRIPKPKIHGGGKGMEGSRAKVNRHETKKHTRSNKNFIRRTCEKNRPDSFLAIQLSQHLAVVGAVRKVQASLTIQNGEMQRVCVAPEKVHITLGVLRLDTPEKLEKAKRTLQGLREKLAFTNGPFFITLEGLSTFRNEVLFLDVAKADGKEMLISLAECVQCEFLKEGLMASEKRSFKPHATIAKMSKVPPFSREKLLGTNKFLAETYKEHLDVSAGRVQVSAIQLCSMDLPANDSGYYHVHSVFELSGQ